MSDTTAIEAAIGLLFRNPDLLWQSLTRPTYARYIGTPEAHNEWLAVFGDTLLDLIVVEYLYGIYGNQYGKGFLSSERDRLVMDVNLIQLAEEIRLSELIRVKGENDQISQKDVTDSFEALLAAVYLDQGLKIAQSWFVSHFLKSSHLQPNRDEVMGRDLSSVYLEEIEAAIDYTFSHKALLQTAITERSHAVARKNLDHSEGLALLGDALLDFIVLEYLYQHKGNRDRGTLSANRDRLVNDSILKEIAHRLGLEKFIRHVGIVGSKNLTDGVEALLAGIYLDRGLDAAREWFFKHLPNEILSQIEQQFCQKSSATQVLASEMLQVEAPNSTVESGYRKLHELLSQGQWQAADLETREVMLRIIGRVDYLPGPAIDEFSCEALREIDQLWVHYSGGRFGFSVQNKILEEVKGNWESFGDRVGWRINQVWQPGDNRSYSLQSPEGHLPSAAIRAAGSGLKARTRILNRVEICRLPDNYTL